jgi:hypothetical protein
MKYIMIITCRLGSALRTLCYGQCSLSIGNGHFQHLAQQKPLNRSIRKFEEFITSAGPPSRPKFIMIGWGVAAPHIGEIYGSRSFSFFPVTSRASPQPTPSARAPHIIHQSTRFRPRKCLLGSHRYVSSHGELSPKNLHIGAVNGDSQLKPLREYLSKGETYHNA